jgi:hypothetical protein
MAAASRGEAMAEWNEFYALVGATAGVLIGLIFVVITRRRSRRKGR